MTAMRRLLRALDRWRQLRARRSGARLEDFMALSDRALADIGLRRAEVFAAMVGVIPLGRRKAAICRLPCRPGPRTIANHFCDAA